ncbi:hypothetical protein BDD12DRAFT_853071 [Trichophaea hybrida]|nr:hypothetical protein BDD12DRAFT_853071 [Trichophaea hybrida]
MPPKTPRTIISATTIVPGSSQVRLADLNTGVKSVRSKRTTTPITATKKTNSRSKSKSKSHSTTPTVKQATLSGFGFAAKPKVPAAQEVGGDRKRRRIISGSAAGSQDNPITIEDEAEEERDEVVIRETQFAGLTQSPGWESDSDLDLDLVEIVRRKSRGDAGKMTPRFSPTKRKKKKKKKNEEMAPRFSPIAHRKAISTQEEKEWDVMATSGIFGEREKSSDLMPPPPVTPKRPRAPLQLPEEIPNSQSPAPSPLKTQLTQTQHSSVRRIGGSKITSPLRVWQSRSPLKTRVGGIAPPVGWTRTRTIVKSSQWWENEDTQDDFSDTESVDEGEVRKDVANDRTKPPLRSQAAGTQDGNGTDSSPLSLLPQKSKSPRLSEGENREDMETTTDDDDSTAPLHSPIQPLSNSAIQGSLRQRAQEVDINIPPDHMEPASPSLKELQGTTQPISSSQHSPAGEVQRNGDIDIDIASVSLEPTPPLSTTHEETQALSQCSTPRESHSQRENYGDGMDMNMTFDLGTPCKRQTTLLPLTPPPPACSHQQPRTPSPILSRSQARETPPFDRSSVRRSSLATTASLSPSTVREMDPSSLTSFNLSPQQLQTQYSSVQETPPTKPSATTPKLVLVDTQINDASPPPEAEDIVLDTPIKDAPRFNVNFHPDSQMRDPEDRYDVYKDHDDHDDNATESQDPNMDFHPVKTQQFPHSMFVRSVTYISSHSPSQSPTNVSQDVGELILEYGEERMEREAEVELPPPEGTQEEVSAPTTTTGLLTTSQLLPETLMESFPLPPLTQFSSYLGDETQ